MRRLARTRQCRVDYIETNVAEEASVEALMAAVADRHGRLDVLVNNAGICIETAIQDTSEAEWDRVMSVNVKSTFLTTKHARELLSGGPDRPTAIVNISSIEGWARIHCTRSTPHQRRR